MELLVFLIRVSTGGYGVAYGSAGFYSLDAERITLPAEARRWAAFAGRGATISRGDLLATIRTLKQRGYAWCCGSNDASVRTALAAVVVTIVAMNWTFVLLQVLPSFEAYNQYYCSM